MKRSKHIAFCKRLVTLFSISLFNLSLYLYAEADSFFEETIDSETLFLIDHYSNDKVSVQYSFVYGIDRTVYTN